MTKFAAVLFAASAAFAAPAFAQDSAITLRVDSGSVMTSAGGEFQAANTGKTLVAGERLMVNAGAAATAVYDGGCTVSFSEPGTYAVPATCTVSTSPARSGNGAGAAVIVGAAVLGAVAIDQMGDKEDVAPISTGGRAQ